MTAVDYVVMEAVGTATIEILLFLVFPMAVPRLDNFTFHTVFVFCEKSAGNTVEWIRPRVVFLQDIRLRA